MAGTHELQIHTIYSDKEIQAHVPRGLRLRILGLATFIVAATWLYATWEPMYKWAHKKLAMGELHIYLKLSNDAAKDSEQDELAAFAQLMDAGKKTESTDSPPAADQAGADEAAPSPEQSPEDRRAAAEAQREALQERSQQRFRDAEIAQSVLAGSVYGWLGIMTFVGLWLIMSAFASFTAGDAGRTLGRIIVPVSLIATIGLIVYVWYEYRWYESGLPQWIKPSVLVLVAVFAASLGAIWNRHGKGLIRLGGVLVILSAVCSMAAIWAAVRWGQMPAAPATPALYAMIFGVQSAYGWIMLFGSIGAH